MTSLSRSGISELIDFCAERGIDFGVWSDLAKQTPGFRYEVRVFGEKDLRVRKTGATVDEAAGEALGYLRAMEGAPTR